MVIPNHQAKSAPLPNLSAFHGVGFLLLAFQIFVYHTHFFDVMLSGMKIPGLSYLIFFVALVASGRLLLAVKSPLTFLWVIYILWGLLASVLGTWRSHSLTKMTACIQALPIVWGIIAYTADRKYLVLNLRLIALCTFLAALIGLFVADRGLERLAYYQGSFSDPNEYSIFLLYGLPSIVFSSVMAKNFAVKLLFLSTTVLVLWAILRTGSRGALVALAVLLLSYFIYSSPLKKMLLVMVCAIGMMVALVVLPQNLILRYSSIFSSTKNLNAEDLGKLGEALGSSESRLSLLLTSIETTVKHPLFGVGPDTFGGYYSDLVKRESGSNTASLTTHNTYTQISSEMGIPNLLVFISILVSSYRRLSWILSAGRAHLEGISEQTVQCAFFLRLMLIGVAAGAFFLSLGYSSLFFTLTATIMACDLVASDEMKRYRLLKQATQAETPLRTSSPLPSPVVAAPLPVPTRNGVRLGRSREAL